MIAAASKKRKVLIISHDFPPVITMGAVRIGKFAKYLPEFGWEPIVLTTNKNTALSYDSSVESVDVVTVRTPCFSVLPSVMESVADSNEIDYQVNRQTWKNIYQKVLYGLVSVISSMPLVRTIPLNGIGWLSYGIRYGKQTIQSNQIDILFSSSNPPVCHIIASRLCRRTKIPWVAEFRDLWSLNPYLAELSRPMSWCQRKIEKFVMKDSCCIVTVSKPLAEDLEKLHSKEVVTITNGFDEKDYSEEVSLTPKFTLTYTGRIYPGKRDPAPLFKAISELKREDGISIDKVEVRFFGVNVREVISPMVKEYGLDDIVKVYGLIPYRESLIRQRESTVLLLLTWNNLEDKGIYTGKVFEYLGAGRPVLAIGLTGSVVDELLNKTGSGMVVNEVEEIKAILINWMREFKTYGEIKYRYSPKPEVISQYTRREQAKQLAAVLNKHCKP
jgi:glycosyltransferase involved in cell wall biosynthesis